MNEKNIYFKKLEEIPLLSKEEEDLAVAKLKGNAKERQEAINTLVEHNLRLSVAFAKKYQAPGILLDDLIQEGNTGLIEAAEKFDPDKNNKFATYATWWVRQRITRYIENNGNIIRIPVHAGVKIRKIKNAQRDLSMELGREPKMEEIAEYMDMDVSDIEDALKTAEIPLSLDHQYSNNKKDDTMDLNSFIEDTSIANPKDDYRSNCNKDALHEIIDRSLNEEEKAVIIAKWGIGMSKMSDEEIAEALHFDNAEAIKKISVSAMRKMKRLVCKEHLIDSVFIECIA